VRNVHELDDKEETMQIGPRGDRDERRPSPEVRIPSEIVQIQDCWFHSTLKLLTMFNVQ
jgi:hypothetical protein